MKSLHKAVINQRKIGKKGILVNFIGDTLHKLVSREKFSELDTGNVILFQMKIFGGNIKDTASKVFHESNCAPYFKSD